MVELLFGDLRGVLVGEEDQSGSCTLAIVFFDDDVGVVQVQRAVGREEEVDYLIGLDAERKPAHQEGYLHVVWGDVISESDCVACVSRLIPLEVQVVSVAYQIKFDVPVADVLTLLFFECSATVILVREEDHAEAIGTTISVFTQKNTLLQKIVSPEKLGDILWFDLKRKST